MMMTTIDQRRRPQGLRAGSSLLGRKLGLFALFVLLTITAGCAQTPQAFVASFDAALASGDVQRVAHHLTPGSRPLYFAMQAVDAAPPPDPATAVANPAGHAAFVPGPIQSKTTFVRAMRDSSGIIFKVEADGEVREWVMQQTGTSWQLDLKATSARASFTGF